MKQTTHIFVKKIINYLLCVIRAQIIDLNFCKTNRIQH